MKKPIYDQYHRMILRECPDSYEGEILLAKLDAMKSFRAVFASMVHMLHRVFDRVNFMEVKSKYKHLLHSRFK